MTSAPALEPPGRRGPARGWALLPTLLLVVPAAAERLGLRVEDESLRLPLVLLALAAALSPSRAAPATPTAVTLLAIGALSASCLADRNLGLLATVGTPQALLAVAAGVAVGARRLRDREAVEAFGAGLALAGVVAAAWVLADAALGRPAIGPLGRAGIAGPTLAALLPFLAADGRRRFASRGLAVGWAPTALAVAAIAATGSRTALVAGGVGLLVSLGLARTGRGRRALLGAAAAVVLAAAVLVPLSAAGALPGRSWVGRSDTLRVRAGLLRAGTALVAERPLAGWGAHGFAAESLRVRDPEEARLSDGRRPLLAHDDYVDAAVEGGVPAGALLVLVVLGALVRSARAAARASAEDRPAAAAVAGAILSIAVAALTENPLRASATAALFGVLAGARASGGVGPVRRGPGFVDLGFLALAALAAGVHGWALGLGPARLLETGAFRRDERSRAAAYAHAAGLVRSGPVERAREAYATLLRHDPGTTEARLDLARLYVLEGRDEDARTVLEEALRHDPTRYEVSLALGHVLLGGERPPSERKPPTDPFAVLRAYNRAAALEGPLGRFETHVAYARVHRRLGDAARAGEAMRLARAAALRRGRGLPGELLLESFRLAEAEGSHPQDVWGVLALALAAQPSLAGEIAAEATACLDAGEREERAAKARAAETRVLDLAVAGRDFDAAALRLAGLYLTGLADPVAGRASAGAFAAEGRHRRALAIYRALLADPFAKADPDLAFEAAKSAARVDGALQATYAARGRTLLGYEALDKGDLPAALRDFRAAVEKAPNGAAGLYGLAKVYARMGETAAARDALAQAALHAPDANARARDDPDLSAIAPPPK